MAVNLTITVRASARAAARILALIDSMTKRDSTAGDAVVLSVISESPPGLPGGRTRSAEGLPEDTQRQAPGVPQIPINPFVAQAVESSMPVRIRAMRTGHNRVVYTLVIPAPSCAVVGVPARITQLLAGSDGMSAKAIELAAGLKRKSVESGLYALRTMGVVRSVEV